MPLITLIKSFIITELTKPTDILCVDYGEENIIKNSSTVKKILTRIALFGGKEGTLVWTSLTRGNGSNPRDVSTTVPTTLQLILVL